MSDQPINISSSNVTGSCTFKCALSFNYPESNGVTGQNATTGINITVSFHSSNPPVLYNNVKYNLTDALLVSPSRHLFNGSNADAELMIIHNPDNGSNKQLFICVPINTTNATSNATKIITNVIEAVSMGANAPGQSTAQIDDFTLNNIVPMKPFYKYENKTQNSEYIVFGISDSISITSDSLATLRKCIQQDSTQMTGSGLTISNKGPTNGSAGLGDDIYIDCQPTGSSEEEENVTVKKKPDIHIGLSADQIFNSPIFIVFLSSLIFIITLLAFHYLLKYITTGEFPGSIKTVPKVASTS